MKLGLNSNLIRKAALLIAPLSLWGGASLYAHDYYHDDEHALRHHEKNEKRALQQHQREERYLYGNSWELRQHQREERLQLRDHHYDEHGYGNQYNRNDDRGYNGAGYYGRSH